MIITTSICANYLPRARALGRSIHAHIPDAQFLVCLTERQVTDFASELVQLGDIDEVVLSKDLGLDEDFNRFIFKHKIVEASTSVKGMLMKHLYDRYPNEDQFVYLDPDCIVFSDFVELKELLKTRPVVIVPHLMAPGHIDMEISSIKYGVYQLGFLALNRAPEAHRFLEWWAERLYLYCYDDLAKGLFTDQRWVDLAPTFFDVEVLHHYGYDFGTWAVKDVAITKQNGLYYINNQPLRFAHFSGYDGGAIQMVLTWWMTKENEVLYKEMIADYAKMLEACGQTSYGKVPWTYACYDNGSKVFDSVRVGYREENALRWRIDDPYRYSNEELCRMLGTKLRKEEPKWARIGKHAIDICAQEGVRTLLKKTLHRLTASNRTRLESRNGD